MIWRYSLEQGGLGIVFAESESEASKKVRDAYSAHSGGDEFTEEITVSKIENGWFNDNPDVIEIDEMR